MAGEASRRTGSVQARLVRAGVSDAEAATRSLARLGHIDAAVLAAVTASPDPDLALRGLVDLVATAGRPPLDAMTRDHLLRDRLATVLGSSAALGQFVARHPASWRDLQEDGSATGHELAAGWRASMLVAVGADPTATAPVATVADAAAVDALRVEYRRRLLRIAAHDLTDAWPIDIVGTLLADLADATLEAALAIGRARLGPLSESCRLAVIGMGKTGGRELNYASDVDVVFVHQPAEGAAPGDAMRGATRLAAHLIQICSAHTGEGSIWQLDAGLRPEGRAGPLVRTLDSHLSYYATWARTWEFQALLKARPVAGDMRLAEEYAVAVAPLVWQAAERPGFVGEVQAMRRRVVATLRGAAGERELKLGTGGLRDVEFAVQLLQLVHGRTDASLRSPTTLDALAALTDGGYVGRDDGATMAQAYRFLRSLEHRVQMHRLRRTHVLPDQLPELRRLGRSLGFRTDPAVEVEAEWRRHRLEVQRLHEKLFYRPLLAAVAAVPTAGLRLSPRAARARLTALGYADPTAALSHLQALTEGVSRRAAIQRQLLPAMLAWFADGPDPDAGLLAFRTLSERLGTTHWYLRQLRDESASAEQLARVLAYSRYATGLLSLAPEAVGMLGNDDELRPRTREQLSAEMTATLGRHHDLEGAARVVRAMRRRELSRVAVADVLGRLSVAETGNALSGVMVATLDAALAASCAAVTAARGRPLPTRLAVVAMGRLGGAEVAYGSDADVLFVHQPDEGTDEQEATQAATDVARTVRRILASPGDDPPLSVDADLRPEGRSGPLVRSVASYAAYYQRWSAPWEIQALLRADPLIGDRDVGRRFAELIAPLRWPADGISDQSVVEIRRIKARVDAERLPRGADPTTHLKLGRGALADVEWAAQLLQLRYAHRVEGLRTTGTLPALAAAVHAGLLDSRDGEAMTTAWRLATRLRNAITLVRGRSSDVLPQDPRVRGAVSVLLGYPVGEAEQLQDDYLRAARRSRAAVERSFDG